MFNNTKVNDEIKILSFEECEDPDVGNYIIQYQNGGREISFVITDLSLMPCQELEELKKEVAVTFGKRDNNSKPCWYDFSEDLIQEITVCRFSEHVIDSISHRWPKDKFERLWSEISKYDIFNSIIVRNNKSSITFKPSVMEAINWIGHPYFGTPCLEEIPMSKEKLSEIKSQPGIYEYADSFGNINYVKFEMNMYSYNDNLYLGLESYDPEVDGMIPFTNITVNINKLPYLHSAIDTNNNGPNLVPFLIENGFGSLTNIKLSSGFCSYPVFKFHEEKLKEVCPNEFHVYQVAHGRMPVLEDKIEAVKTAGGVKENSTEKELER